jgi:3-(3-hydroxy-phenyl)propionate hydroxylase
MPLRPGRRIRPGSLIPNPPVCVPGAGSVRLDAILAGRTTMLTARQPEEALADMSDRYGIQLLRIRSGIAPDEPARSGSPAAREPDRAPDRWLDVWLAEGESSGAVQALVADPSLAILVRPDRVIAAVAAGRPLPVVPWSIQPLAGARPAARKHAIVPDPAGSAGN